MKIFPYLLGCYLLIGCGDATKDVSLKEEINWINNPLFLPGSNRTLNYKYYELPDIGSVPGVWDGYWYPNSKGGTAYKSDNNLTALEKYDQAVGDDQQKATKWEIQNAKELGAIAWSGHCNGLAAASTMTKEPKTPVNYNGVYFSVDDIKTLLTELWQSGGTVVGGRCNSEQLEYDANGRITADECRDMNPATFHLLVTNFLGMMKKPVLADVDLTYAVWNYPIKSYNILYKQNASIKDVTYWLYGKIKDTYDYNAKATSFAYIQMQVLYGTIGYKIYEYILELDKDNKIIGGEWYRNTRSDHPDFLWRHTNPTPENPHLSVTTIYEIYNRSIGADTQQ